MDHDRFDRLTRLVARRTDRRVALRAGLGAGVTLVLGRRPASAAPRLPGEACSSDSQCLGIMGTPYFCRDNGFVFDGPHVCCAFDGGYCESSDECCGDSYCFNGDCRSPLGPFGAGRACWSDAECDPALTGLACDFAGDNFDARVCCQHGGGVCEYDDHCCGWLVCLDGRCI